MNRNTSRARGRRAFHLEFLEGRQLLSHVPKITRFLVPSPHPPIPIAPALTGSLDLNRASAGLYTPTPPGRLSFSGNGLVNPPDFGNATIGLQQSETVSRVSGVSTTNITLGRGVLTSRFGEQIQISYTGQVRFPRHARHPITLTGTVVSGTGRFEGATGSFSASGTILNPNQFHLNFRIVPIYRTS